MANNEDEFDGTRTLTPADLAAIRETIFERAPISLMDTQKIVLENKELRKERDKLANWISSLVDQGKSVIGQQ